MSINIAIDGPSAAGKSTIAKNIAKMLNYRYLDTGAMYRCVALKAKKLGIEANDERKIMAMLKETIISFDASGRVFLDKKDVSDAIRENDISLLASQVSLLKEVRSDMVERQREIAASQPGIILDGRDIGSVVLPSAQLKIYLSARSEIRALRRYEELLARGVEADFTELLDEIVRRDEQDSKRENSPLTKCEDAIEIDSSFLTIEEVSQKIYSLALERGA